MKDIWILSAAAALMIAVMLAGQWFRGDYSQETLRYEPVVSDLGNLAVEKDGRALINVNLADAEMLTRIDGIGPTLAERIVAYREEYGYFTTLDELLKVDGVGTKKLQAMKERLICLP